MVIGVLIAYFFRPSGIILASCRFPTACAVGYILPPLPRLFGAAVAGDWSTLTILTAYAGDRSLRPLSPPGCRTFYDFSAS